MRIVVLTGGSTLSGAGWHVQDLARAAKSLGHRIVTCSWRRLVGHVGCNGPTASEGQLRLEEADVVLLRTMPPGSLEQIVFRMDLVQRLEAAGVVVVNRPRAIEVAVDKYLALARMQAAGIPVPPTVVCQQRADANTAFERLGGDVVIKPIFGSEGFGIMRITDHALAERAFAALDRMNSVIYVQRFIDHDDCDLRLFVLGDRVLAAMQRHGADFCTNIARGGVGLAVCPEVSLCDLARRAASVCHASIAGVDIVVAHDGQPFVLEVNAVPGWRALAQATGIDIAAAIVLWLHQRVAASTHV